MFVSIIETTIVFSRRRVGPDARGVGEFFLRSELIVTCLRSCKALECTPWGVCESGRRGAIFQIVSDRSMQ